MESCDSSPDYTRATTNSDGKKENSHCGSECDETLSLSSSTRGWEVNGLPDKYWDTGIKNRTNKKTLKNFRNLKTFRRRARSRAGDRIFMDMSDDVVTPPPKFFLQVSDETPHYMQATSSSKGKKANFQEIHQNSEICFDNSDLSSSHSSQSNVVSLSIGSMQTSLTALNLRNVKILIKKTSFKPKRSSKYSQVSQDVNVDRATCSSTLKDSKFAKRVELVPGETEPEKISLMKVCRYHHCSLHGHCDETHDPVHPQKRLLYNRRRLLKKQKSKKPKSKSMPVTKSSRDKKKDLQRWQMICNVQPLVQGESDSIATAYVDNEGDASSSCALEVKMSETPSLSALNGVDSDTEINTKPKTRLFGDGYNGIRESDLVEIAFGETSYPEESYKESLKGVKNYVIQEQGIVCLKCSCIKRQPNEYKRTAHADFSHPQVPDSNLGNGYNHETRRSGAADFSDTHASAISLKLDEQISAQNKDTTTSIRGECDFTPSDMSNALTPDNFDEVTESNKVISPASDNTRFHEENKPLFSKVRHISMWNLIHQHMAESMAAESANEPLHGVDGSNVLPAKESSQLRMDFSDMGIVNSDCETQDVDVRKLFAVKLVREAIEKILLPEVQDQTSDNQSTTSDATHEHELFEKNQDEGGVQESFREYEPVKGEGNEPADLKEVGVANTDISGQEIVQTDKKFGSKSEKKAPKHWSNLKKWILLQRFIKELEKVRKFNPRSPQHLPLKPERDSEKVNLRPQTVDERKKAEEWMLDYALRQAVSQLAPTQKRKVSLLVKAFETVVTPNEGNSQKFAGIIHEVDESVRKENGEDKEAKEIVELKSDNGETALKHNLQGIKEDTIVCLNSEFPTSNFLWTIGKKETNPDYRSIESKNLILDGNGLLTEDTISSAVHCGTRELETIVRVEAYQDAEPELRVFQEVNKSDNKDSETKNGSHNVQLEKQNYIRIWHSINQHVVSGIAAKVGSQLLDGTDDDEVEDCNELSKINNGDYFPKSDYDPGKENRIPSHLKSAFTKTDALKLVQEAVDEIVLPEVQDDSSDTQSVTSDFSPDQEISGSLDQENETQCTTCEGGISVGQEDQKQKSARKPESLKSKNWSKLKKLILLKRSIKALEKARKLNLRPPRHFSVMPDTEQEKADLRHQMMDERKKAEQWMLDYSVQHIVTKLTPARKRRVSMLVEAFEAVVPLPEKLTP